MKEFLAFLESHWLEISAAFASVIAVVTAVINLRKNAKLSKALESAKTRGTQVICPYCKKSAPLSEVRFILPTGELDQNLNGVPDNAE